MTQTFFVPHRLGVQYEFIPLLTRTISARSGLAGFKNARLPLQIAGARRLTWICCSFQIDRRMDDLDWFVAHTLPRCEKKLFNWCTREHLEATLPCYTTVHKYRGKVARFQKPLFPGYLFLKLTDEQNRKVRQSDYVARVLTVVDQDHFHHQLMDILQALEKCAEIQVVPEIGEGTRVRVKHGPLRGMDGWVEKRYGMSTVLFRLDFIGQAAAVRLEAWELEPS